MSHPSGISKDVVRAGPATLHSHLQLRRCWKGQEGVWGRAVGVPRVPPYREKLGCQHFPEARGGGVFSKATWRVRYETPTCLGSGATTMTVTQEKLG